MEIEKQIAFNNNNLTSFKEEKGYFQTMPLTKIIWSIQLVKVHVLGDGGPKGRQPSLDG